MLMGAGTRITEVIRCDQPRPSDATETTELVVHNHPSDYPMPSRADIEMTRAIVDLKPLAKSLLAKFGSFAEVISGRRNGSGRSRD